jgi:dsDNA-specific endonuclease/ATPase MutS2
MKIKEMGPAQEHPEPSDNYERTIFAAELGNPPELKGLHGVDVHDALRAVDHFINHEFLEGSEAVKIVHGRGTGKLREAIHRFLKNHELVARFRDANDPNQQGGVTFVALYSKDRPSEPRLREA